MSAQEYSLEISGFNYVIKRISDVDQAENKIEKFWNDRNRNLVDFIKDRSSFGAIESDKNNSNAVYLVIDCDTDEIAMYYSLRTSMFSKKYEEQHFSKFRYLIRSLAAFFKKNKLKIPLLIPTIDLSMFCKNSNYSRVDFVENLGQNIFVKVIYDQVLKTREIVGIQYITVNAADDGSGDLIKYYINKLAFEESQDSRLTPIQEEYDKNCKFLIHPIEEE